MITPVRITIHLANGNRIEELVDNVDELDEETFEKGIFDAVRYSNELQKATAPHWEQIGSTLVFTGAVSAVELTHFG